MRQLNENMDISDIRLSADQKKREYLRDGVVIATELIRPREFVWLVPQARR